MYNAYSMYVHCVLHVLYFTVILSSSVKKKNMSNLSTQLTGEIKQKTVQPFYPK